MISIKKLLTILATLAVVFVLLPLAALYFAQERLLFRPAVLAQNYAFRFARPFEEIRLPAADGTVLHGLHFAADAPAKGRLLFFHGNAGALDSWGEVAERFAALGYESYVFDYRGYGKSGGQIDNQDQLYADAERMAKGVWWWSASRLAAGWPPAPRSSIGPTACCWPRLMRVWRFCSRKKCLSCRRF